MGSAEIREACGS